MTLLAILTTIRVLRVEPEAVTANPVSRAARRRIHHRQTARP
jgi:hypothetical protein